MKLYVGNLPYDIDDEGLKNLFASFGAIVSAKVIIDRDSGRSKGFGFVEFGSKDEATVAIKDMNGKMVGQKAIIVNEARPQEKKGFRPSFNNNKRSYR